MSQESLLILPPSFPPRQAKDLVIDWLKANPVAPSDVASAAFDLVKTVLVPVHFVKITGSASFDGVVKYTRTVTNVMREEGYTDEPNEFPLYERDDEGNNMLVGFGKRVNGQVQCSIQDRAVTLLSDLAPAPDYDLSRSRPASADELSLPRLTPDLSDAEWNERIHKEVDKDALAQANHLLLSAAPPNARNVSVYQVSVRDVQSEAHDPIKAWATFYHLRYRYQTHEVDVLVDGQTRDPYGQRISSTMKTWQASERVRQRELRKFVLVEIVLVLATAVVYVWIVNPSDWGPLAIGFTVFIILLTHLAMFAQIARLLRPTPKPKEDQSVREGQDIGKLLQA